MVRLWLIGYLVLVCLVFRYVGWSNCDQQAEQELAKYFLIPNFFHPSTYFGTKTWFFMGTPGYGAPSHLDQVVLPSWQAQVGLKYLGQRQNR